MAMVDNINEKHEEDLQRLRGFRLLDDDFMTKVFEDKECAELLLKIILVRDDIKVVTTTPQNGLKNLQGRSVRLDILVEDQNGRFFNVEIQRSDKGADRKRARYNSALIDANITEPGEEFQNIQETFVIFITENDVLKAGLPIYHIERVIKELGVDFDDQAHIVYVNSQIQDETALGRLMHDFSCIEAKDMHYPVLADRVRFFKEDQEGVKIMCRAMEDMRNESINEGKAEEKRETIMRLFSAGKDLETIAIATGLVQEDIQKVLDVEKAHIEA